MSKLEVVLATNNAHKKDEIAAIVRELELPLVIVEPTCAWDEVIEDGQTLEENAIKKAREVCAATGQAALADDTGLEIDALGGAPGIFAARWGGEGCSFADNVSKALRELDGVAPERRSAHFRTVVALCLTPEAEPICAEGRLEGRIAQEAAGAGGFGYDPVFFLPDDGCCIAELDEEAKNRISHRRRALEDLGRKLAE